MPDVQSDQSDSTLRNRTGQQTGVWVCQSTDCHRLHAHTHAFIFAAVGDTDQAAVKQSEEAQSENKKTQ